MKVFVSYRRTDTAETKRIVDSLRHRLDGIDLIFDETDISPGEDFYLWHSRALEFSDAAIVIVGRRSEPDSSFRSDIDWLSLRPIIPVFVDREPADVSEEWLRRALGRFQWLRVRTETWEHDIGAVENALARLRDSLAPGATTRPRDTAARLRTRAAIVSAPLLVGLAIATILTLMFWGNPRVRPPRASPEVVQGPPRLSPEVAQALIRTGAGLVSLGLAGAVCVLALQAAIVVRIDRGLKRIGGNTPGKDS